MATGNIPDYQGALGSVERIEDGFNVWIKVYNDLGSAVTNGDVYHLSYEKDADSLDPSARPTLVACATTSVAQHVCVVNNAPLGAATIADQAYGFVQIRGYCPTVKMTTAAQAVDRYLQATNTTQAATDDGTSRTTDSFAISVSTAASNYGAALLFGDPCIIG